MPKPKEPGIMSRILERVDLNNPPIKDVHEAFAKDVFDTNRAATMLVVDEQYHYKPHHCVKLCPGKVVAFEGMTFTVRYVNDSCVVLEPKRSFIIGG